MDYSSGKFGDCSFSRFGSIVRTDRHTDRQQRMSAILPLLSMAGVNTRTKDVSSPATIDEQQKKKCCHDTDESSATHDDAENNCTNRHLVEVSFSR